MARGRNTEAELVDIFTDCYGDPLKFVLFAYPWGEKGGPLERFPDGPDEWQREKFAEIKEHVHESVRREMRGEDEIFLPYKDATASGHGIGKTAFLSWVIHWLMSTRNDMRGRVTANTGSQLETTTWVELAKWHKMSVHEHWFTHTATSFYHNSNKEGWRFDAIPWNLERTEAFAGMHNAGSSVCYIFDEASAIPGKIWEVSEGAMTDGEPWWFVFGNPTQNSGKFYDCFHTQSHRWRTKSIDSRTVRITNKRQINEWLEDFGEDSDFFKVRVRGVFPSGGENQYILGSTIDAAVKRKLDYDPNSEVVLACDVARGGGDLSVVGLREGRILDKDLVWTFDIRDSMELAKKIYALYEKYKPDAVHIDGAGLGGPIFDRLKEMGMKNVYEINGGAAATDKHRHLNVRGEMYHNLKHWLEGADIPDVGELVRDLRALQYDADRAKLGQYHLETKKEFKKREGRSCDYSDMLAISLARPVRRRLDRNVANSGQSMYAESNYDMFGQGL